MTAAIKSAVSAIAQPGPEPNGNAIRFLDEKLSSVPASDIPELFRKLSRFFPVIVLVPKSAVDVKETTKKREQNKSDSDLTDTTNVYLPLDAAKGWLPNSSATDRFEFGAVRGCFSTMEIHCNDQPVTLTNQELKILAYLIKNPLKVISRDELLNEVWGYENSPCTRTAENHVLRLRKKLEAEPAQPRHFRTIHGTGYRFVP